MLLYWSLINYVVFIVLSAVAILSLQSYMKELLNKKNYILQLPKTSAQNLQEIQFQCEEILTQNENKQEKKNGKPKFQLMELSKITIQEIQEFIQNISFIRHQFYNILVNYHCFINFLKDDQKYPKIILQKQGMFFLFLLNILFIFHMRVMYQKYFAVGEMTVDIKILLLITISGMVINLFFNKYLVILEYNHSYYTLFNKLKFKKKEQEEYEKELDEHSIYDRSKFKQYLKPIKLYAKEQDEENNKSNTVILEMEEKEENEQVITEEDVEMIARLEEQGEYYGLYYYLLMVMALLLFLVFIEYEYLFNQVNSNQHVLLSVIICFFLDGLLRTFFCFIALLISCCTTKYSKLTFEEKVQQIQIYEVFEEHIKLGITCLDENYQEDTNVFEDYSLISYGLNETSVKLVTENKRQTVDEHWFFKTVRKVKETVQEKLERAHMPEIEYERKHKEVIEQQKQKEQEQEQEEDLKDRIARQQKQIKEFLEQKAHIERTAQIQKKFLVEDDMFKNSEQKQRSEQHNQLKSQKLGGLRDQYEGSHLKEVLQNDQGLLDTLQLSTNKTNPQSDKQSEKKEKGVTSFMITTELASPNSSAKRNQIDKKL